MESYPTLTEPGVQYFLCEILKQCRDRKYAIYSKLFNITLFLIFVFLLGSILYYRHKGKMTETEKKARKRQEEIYITQKIKGLHQKSMKKENLIITDLPKLDSGFDVLHKNYYSV